MSAAAIGLADTRKSVGAVWLDADEDGDLDVYVGNMDGDANALYRNDKGQFTDVGEPAGLAWGGRAPRDATNGTVRPCAADVDNDGRLDLFAANYGTNGLFLNRGSGKFEDVSTAWGIAIDARYDACAFADFDNDGRLDLYVNGTVTGGTSYRDYLFRNTGSAFEDVTPDNIRALEADHGVQWADVDLDGDLDLALDRLAPGRHAPVVQKRPAGSRSRDDRSACAWWTAAVERRAPAPRSASMPRERAGCSARASSTPDQATTRRTTRPCTSVSRARNA